jgi:hypothetical protein
VLARSKKVQRRLKENWGNKDLKPILAMMRVSKLEGALGEEIHDFLDDLSDFLATSHEGLAVTANLDQEGKFCKSQP